MYSNQFEQAKYLSLKQLVERNNLEQFAEYFNQSEYDPQDLDLDRIHDSIQFRLNQKSSNE